MWRAGVLVLRWLCVKRWCDTPSPIKKKSHSLCATVITRMFNTSIPEQVIVDTSHLIRAPRLSGVISTLQQQAVTASINNTVSDPIASPTSRPRMSTTVLFCQPCLVFQQLYNYPLTCHYHALMLCITYLILAWSAYGVK